MLNELWLVDWKRLELTKPLRYYFKLNDIYDIFFVWGVSILAYCILVAK